MNWTPHVKFHFENVEACELVANYDAYSETGREAGAAGDFLIRPAGSEDRKTWHVVTREVAERTLVSVADSAIATAPGSRKPATKKRAPAKKPPSRAAAAAKPAPRGKKA